jgi:hypothetical protein
LAGRTIGSENLKKSHPRETREEALEHEANWKKADGAEPSAQGAQARVPLCGSRRLQGGGGGEEHIERGAEPRGDGLVALCDAAPWLGLRDRSSDHLLELRH